MSISEQIIKLPYVRKDNLALLFPDIKPASFDQNVKNWLKAGKLIKLKRGFYVPEEYWQNYANIKRQLFCGFSRAQFEGKNYDIASKSKALFDYLYFAKRTIKHANAKTVAELRLNLEGFSSADWREFEDYLAIARSEKMRRIYQALRSKHAF